MDAAELELALTGHEKATMLSIARRAGASKETLYSWFVNKEGLFRALVEREIDRAGSEVRQALAEGDPPAALANCARVLLDRAVAENTIALRRAAAASLELGPCALAREEAEIHGVIERYLAQLARRGIVVIPDVVEAGRLYRTLVIRDLEMQLLLGEKPLAADEIEGRAHEAVDQFLTLVALDAGARC